MEAVLRRGGGCSNGVVGALLFFPRLRATQFRGFWRERDGKESIEGRYICSIVSARSWFKQCTAIVRCGQLGVRCVLDLRSVS